MKKVSAALLKYMSGGIYMLFLMLLLSAPMEVHAAGVTYEFGFVDENGNRLYGDLIFSQPYKLDKVIPLTERMPTYTVELASGDYYDITFRNEDGYYSFYTVLISQKDVTEKPKHSVKTYPIRIPCTVTVKYNDNTPASGVTVKTDYENSGGVTTGNDGTCKVYLTIFDSVNIQVYDGYKWVSRSVKATSAGAKAETFTIDRRVSAPVKVMIGGQEVASGWKIKATSGDDSLEVTESSLPCLIGKTYTVSVEHEEWDTSAFIPMQYKGGYSASGISYAANINPSTLIINAKLTKPKPYYWDYSSGSLQFKYPEDGSSYTLTSGSTLSLSLDNRIKSGATYTYTSSDTDVFTVNGGTITAKNPGTATLTIKAQYGTDSSQMTMNIVVPKRLINSVSPSLTPRGGEAPVTSITESGYSGSVSWDINTSVFDFNTAYKATLVLTPDDKHYFDASTTAEGFQVSYDSNTGKLTLVKEYTTGKAKITSMMLPQDMQLSVHSSKEEVLAGLPACISGSAENGTCSLPVVWTCTDFSKVPEAGNIFTWSITDIKDLDANGHELSGTITVTNPKALEVNHTAKHTTIVYDGSTIDVSRLFELDTNAGKASYTVDGEKGTIEGSTLTIKEAGILDIKVSTEPKGIYGSGEAVAQLTVKKGTGEASVSLEDWTYGELSKNPVPQSATNSEEIIYYYKASDEEDAKYTLIQPVDAGNYILKAVFQENKLYNSVTVTDEFTIHKKSITVKADDFNKVYGEEDPSALTWSVISETLVGSDTLIVDIKRAGGEMVGTYEIMISEKEDANPNYNITFENGRFEITKAPLVITAEDKHIVYGEKAPEYTVSFSGFKNGDDKAALDGELTFESVYEPGMDKGSYTIKAGGYRSDNYMITYEDGTLYVAIKPVTLIIEHKNSSYGDKIADLTALDLQNDIFDGDENVYALSTDASENKDVGFYDIVGETLDNNYKITFMNGEDAYEIIKREITLSIIVEDKQYDGLNTAVMRSVVLNNILERDEDAIGLNAGTSTFASVDAAENIEILFTEFALTGEEEVLKNYNLIQPTGITASITNNWIPKNGLEYMASEANENGWLNRDFVIRSAEGYELSEGNAADGVWTESFTGTTEGADNSIAFYVRNKATGAISLMRTEMYKLDKNTEITGTTGKVYFDERNGWESFLNTITFGIFYPTEVTVKVDAQDALSGVASIEYTESQSALKLEKVRTLDSWKAVPEGGVPVTLEDEKQFVYYVKITDAAGNVSYLSSDGAEYDTTAPAIEGVDNQEIYYTTQVVYVKDKNLKSIHVNGEKQTDLEAPIVLKGDFEATYKIIAADAAGNITEYTIETKRIKAIKDSMKDIASVDANPRDIETLEKIVIQIEELLKDKDLTSEEKEQLEAVKKQAEELIVEVKASIRAKAKMKEMASALTEGTAAPATGDTTNFVRIIGMLIASAWICIISGCVIRKK